MQEILSNILEHPLTKTIWAWVVIALGYLFGDFDMVLQAMIVAVLSDFVLGFALAVYEGNFCKEKFLKGLKKEMTFAGAIIIGNLADLLIFHAQVEWWVQNFFIVYIGINELISSLRHLSKLGFKTPEKLIKRLERQTEKIGF